MSDFDYTDYDSHDESAYSSDEIAVESEMSAEMHDTTMEIIDNIDGSDDYTYEYDGDGY